MKKIILLIFFAFFILASTVFASQFVETDGTNFVLNGKPFYFAGTNTFYLFYKSLSEIRNVMDDAVNLNISVIRTWGFCDGSCGDASGYSFQPDKGVYSETTFSHFDQVIKEASDRNLKLIIPFVNNWNTFGGMCEYVKWCNTSIGSCSDLSDIHDRFYTGQCEKDAFKAYIANFLNRTNTLTGIPYKDDPTILAWELANEPRCRSDPTGAKLNAWIGEMSAYIKSLDQKHLVTTGIEGGYQNRATNSTNNWWYTGHEGQAYLLNHDWSTIDFAVFHYYPDSRYGGIPPEVWMQEHISDAHNVLEKPVLFEEFLPVETNRATTLESWYQFMQDEEIDGTAFWMLTGIPNQDGGGYEVMCPEDSDVCDVILNHTNFMLSLSAIGNDAPVLQPIDNVGAPEGSLILVQAFATDPESDPITYSINDTRWTQDGSNFTWQTTQGDQGEYWFEVTASDGSLNSTVLFKVTIYASGCVVPSDGMQITHDTALCYGTYHLQNGIEMVGNNIVLDCNGSTIKADFTGEAIYEVIIRDGSEGITLKNCIIQRRHALWGQNVLDVNILDSTFSNAYVNLEGDNILFKNNYAYNYYVQGNNHTVVGNIFNGYDHVIRIYRGYNSLIANNTIDYQNFARAISMDGAYNNLIEGNTIRDGASAIYCWYQCYNNTFRDNDILRNNIAISGDATNNYYNNRFYHNNFINNTAQASNIPDSSNLFSINEEGNYWTTYDEQSEGCTDSDNNGICDEPYIINSDNTDFYPFTEQDGWLNPPQLECGSSTNMDFCQNCYANGGRVKPGEAGCWCETFGYYINAWFGTCPEYACNEQTPCGYSFDHYGHEKSCKRINDQVWAWTYCISCNGLGCEGLSSPYTSDYPTGTTYQCQSNEYVCTGDGWALLTAAPLPQANSIEILPDDEIQLEEPVMPLCNQEVSCSETIDIDGTLHWCRFIEGLGWIWTPCANCDQSTWCQNQGYTNYINYPLGTKASCESKNLVCTVNGWKNLPKIKLTKNLGGKLK